MIQIDIMLKTDLTKFNNSWYYAEYPAGKPKIILWFIINSLTINSYLPIPIAVKAFILRLFGAKIGSGFVIKPKVNIKFPWLLEVGNNVWIGELVWIDNFAKVTIADNACVSQGAMLLTGNHDYKKSTFDLMIGEIYLEEGAWIGAKAVVCPGIRCKSHSVLTVSSVATKDLTAYSIYQGNPAVLVKTRTINQ
ncbi:putative colanic acid biosynthesis acetyltransferase WcaF [Pseudarcicella hirudinis]|uniref:Putative colanic acid biosynthesis acetyltransferase WcaF n=2 Tax=Pseudarcicella hirudinis TaxID=1079859 RepID=A0A1I5Y6L0_9BACT|nr:putative colanic acid biosynthesis acetyltransferase WcaF [Pseudarcicella hirudinis]